MTNKFQTYLNQTGKTILSITCAAMLTLSCSQITLASEQSSTAPSSSSDNTADSSISTGTTASASTVIGAEAAQNLAFADAGVDPLSAESVFTEYDYDDGEFLYEVDFTVEDIEYEYQIQAYDGSVLKKTIEYLGLKKTISLQTDTTTTITLEEAKELALADTGLTDEELELVTFTKEKSDEDDGISVYDIEFYTDTAEYEYEISTLTGDILELSIKYGFTAQDLANNTNTERDSADSSSLDNTGSSNSDSTNSSRTESAGSNGSTDSSSASYISLDEAKSIALEYAGLSDSDVTFKKAKLDKEHGTMVYEIEFYQGRTEYECEINAVTGTVIEFEVDH
ncbi:MAG: PepSY domain-containing protein [Lachnospiraceae bacterium]|nr:PepSY domain-containing protein [Lachnospiraceae bacterium]